MSVRALDINGDFTFGQGRNNYLTRNKEVAQNIQTRLRQFLGDCWFSIGSGIDWFNLLGGKNKAAIQLAVSTTIRNTKDVTGVIEVSVNVDNNRRITISYTVTTIYSGTSAASGGIVTGTTSFLLVEDGSILDTEGGDPIIT
jgi:hypothetical protein